MTYRIETAPAAQRDIKKALKTLSKKDAKAVFDAIGNLEHYPRPTGVKKLSGGNSLYRLRVGNFRIIYQIRDSELLVILLKVGDRRDSYVRLLQEAQDRLQSLGR